MKKIVDRFGGKLYFISILIFLAVAAFLRLYRIQEFATFLGDQGRDAIIMKDIITFHDFTALGPITSVGSIYLGPFYYYFMSPWLGLFGLNPVGPAIGVAIINVIGLLLMYFAVRDLINKQTAVLSVAFAAFSWVLIEFSRFSWNPNILPITSFFVVYSTIKAIRTGRWYWFAALGTLVSAAVQLHYLAIFLLPFVGGAVLYWLFKDKKDKWMLKARNLIAAAAGFALVISPFIIFEIKHKFPNMNSVIRFANENRDKAGTGGTYSPLANLLDTSNKLTQYIFQIELGQYLGGFLSLLILATITAVIVWNQKTKKQKHPQPSVTPLLFAFFTLLIGTSLYHGPKFAHYLGALYLLFYILLAYALTKIAGRVGPRAGAAIIGIIFALFVVSNYNHFIFLWQDEGHKQIERSRNVAQVIRDMNPQMPYTLTTSPEAYADYPYRYYLDAWGKKPVPKEEDALILTKELFVICEKKCDPMADSQWAIAHFSARKVADEKRAEGLYIYRLTK